MRQQLAWQVEARRAARGHTRQDVERAGKTAAGIVGRIESGTSLPSLETLMRLCTGLACEFVVSENGIRLVPRGKTP